MDLAKEDPNSLRIRKWYSMVNLMTALRKRFREVSKLANDPGAPPLILCEK